LRLEWWFRRFVIRVFLLFWLWLLCWLFTCGVGLFLYSYWAVCFPGALAFSCILIGLFVSPLCGAALTFFAAAKKVSKESGSHRQPVGVSHWTEIGAVRNKMVSRAAFLRDQALIRSSVALRAPPSGITPSANSVGILNIVTHCHASSYIVVGGWRRTMVATYSGSGFGFGWWEE
jgi:hypothetical protein